MKDRLHERYRRLIIGSVIPLALIIMVLGVYQFLATMERELDDLRLSVIERRITLNAIVKAAGDHVQEMRLWAERYLEDAPRSNRSELRSVLRSRAVGDQTVPDGVFLDAAPPRLRDQIGNFFGETRVFERRGDAEWEVDMALDLFPSMWLAHQSTPYFQWSYYFSGREDFVAIFPWVNSATVIDDLGRSSMQEYMPDMFDHEIFHRAKPESNPQQRAYWLDPYLDEIGAGLMVSHCVPVYQGERFMGMVGTDIRLDFLTKFLQEFDRPVGKLWIVTNRQHQVLAGTDGLPAAGDKVPQLAAVLPEPLGPVDIEDFVSLSDQFREINGYQVLALAIEAVPWTMLYVVPTSEVRSLVLPRLAPYGIILVSLVLTFFVAQYFLRRWFVAPALNLVSYISSESKNEGQELPEVPGVWRPWLEMIADAFEGTRARQAAEAANRAKSQFLATMSHELRTPLNGVLGYAQILLRDTELTPKQRQGIKVIHRSGEHLLRLINDILDLARIEAGKLELNPVDFELSKFMQDIEAEFAVRISQKGLRFALQVDDELPACVHGDKQKLHQILFNLIGNAVKFTGHGEIVLSVRAHGDRVRFVVSDTGCGVAPKDLKRLFQPFRQVGSSEVRTEGTGLGLAISHSMVALMGGELQVASVLNKGSTFSFAIPLPAAVSAPAAEPTIRRRVTGYRGSKRRVLIVDDKVENRAVLADMLSPLGFETAQAGDGEAALRMANTFKPHLVLMDIRMPIMDGYEAARRLRQSTELRRVKIIVVSASAFEHDRDKCIAVGADDFLSKPFSQDKLLDVIADQLGLEWIETGSSAAPPAEATVREALIIPPEDELLTLRDLTLRGDIKQILNEADRFERLDPRYGPFAAQLRRLARGFQLAGIDQLLSEVRQAS